ncbi:hypothetical protein [Gluconacetobacter tumulisoli]|uniref:TnsE C-terminal domain-containing protein n=1 Tax=Gluconacetobacter tumulisoli TaxID=1286189 RepID=A0A7W4K759_9PROT|nr:hypothetical protein [Gluconacetobacter tumulisoli]MBB2201644.1 hypothetical protein [Gluconacetobacter tumulisoli]
MTDSGRLRYDGFPMDGRHRWLRWIDGLDLHGPTGSPTIKAHLVTLPDAPNPENLLTLAVVAASGAPITRHEVVVGSLPALRLGMVFLDGEHVGDLRMERFERRSLGPSRDAELIAANSPVETPEWASVRWTVLPTTSYPLGNVRNSFCLRLVYGGCEVIIPASEVFRVFCAPERLLANVILSGEWKDVAGKLLNESFCEKTPTEWRVGLRTGLTGASAAVLAAYRWTDAGAAVRNQLRSGLLQNDHRLQAMIPYGFEGIELSGEGLKLSNREGTSRFLMLRISAVRITGLHEMRVPVRFRLDNYTVKRSSDREMKDRTPFVQTAPIVEESTSEPIALSIAEPPSSAAIERQSPCEAAAIEGLPEVSRLPLDPPMRPEAERRRRLTVLEPTNVGSTAMHQRGHRPVGSFAHLPEVRASLGFDAVGTVLNELLRTRDITSWMPVIPLDRPWRTVSGLEAWDLPAEIKAKRAAFSFLRDGNRRTCLVIEITLGQEKVFWLELERRLPVGKHSDGFCYLLLKVRPDYLEDAIGRLLMSAVKEKGVWKLGDVDKGTFAAKAFRHAYYDTGAIRIASASRSIRSFILQNRSGPVASE